MADESFLVVLKKKRREQRKQQTCPTGQLVVGKKGLKM
jgi:hypothetical protein